MGIVFFNDTLAFVAVFLIIVGAIALTHHRAKHSNIYLGMFFLLMGIISAFRFMELSKLMLKIPFLMDMDFPLAFLILPSYYFFIKAFLFGYKPTRTEIFIHSMPALMAFLFLSPIFFYNTTEKLNYILHETISSTSHYYRILNPAFFLQSMIYLISILMFTIKTKTSDKPIQNKRMKWTLILTGVMIALQLSALLFQYFVKGDRKFKYFPLEGFFVFLVLLIWLLYESNLIKNEDVYKEANSKIKYQHSTLTANEIALLADQISDLMIDKKMFLDKNLSLAKLASEINLPSRTLSEVINRQHSISFNEMVNKLRVEHSKILLLEHSKLLTIDAIGENSGFSSRASFYSNFKKVTNLSPFEFVKNSNK